MYSTWKKTTEGGGWGCLFYAIIPTFLLFCYPYNLLYLKLFITYAIVYLTAVEMYRELQWNMK